MYLYRISSQETRIVRPCAIKVHSIIYRKSLHEDLNSLTSLFFLSTDCFVQLRESYQARIKKEMLFFCWLIIKKPQPNLYSYSGDTSIQGTLALVPRVSPEWFSHTLIYESRSIDTSKRWLLRDAKSGALTSTAGLLTGSGLASISTTISSFQTILMSEKYTAFSDYYYLIRRHCSLFNSLSSHDGTA